MQNFTSPSLGAIVTDEGVRFRLWAPQARTVEIAIEDPQQKKLSLRSLGDGYFGATDPYLKAGARYRYIVDGKGPFPDPCSRYQPEGPHGPSMIVDHRAHRWRDSGWSGVEMRGQVIYELHIGAFTPVGNFHGALERLPHLQSLGATAVEVMPVAECPGRWNWGYDGVNLFAPSHRYGDYDAFKRFVDEAHRLGLAVILDVVYNHIGPDGNYLPQFSPSYFTDRYPTEWGPTFDFESAGVRQFVLENACYWIREFHLDGLRLDATQSIFDFGQPHILAELSECTRAAAGGRKILLLAENEPQRATHLWPVAAGGFGFDAIWNDDFHHSARVALTGKREAYFHDYAGRAQEFVSTAKRGFLFQGQHYHWQQKARGEPLSTPLCSCIAFLQNHDQVANSLRSARVNTLASASRYRALTPFFLLMPQTPLLFMGQEFGATTPFYFFADHAAGLREKVYAGRRSFLAQFPGIATPIAQGLVADPAAESTFLRSKLEWQELIEHPETFRLHTELLALRREDAVLSQQDDRHLDGAVLGEHAFVLRWFDSRLGDRLLVVNLATEIHLDPAPEPLLAPPLKQAWELVLSSEETRYGGGGVINPLSDRGWRLPAETAVLFRVAGARS